MTKWTVGDISISSVIEQELGGFEQYMPDVTGDVVESASWLRPHFATDQGSLLWLIQSFVVETKRHKVLVDTCIGNDKSIPSTERPRG